MGFPFGSRMETLGATKYSLQLRRSGWRQAMGHSKEPRPDQARPSGGGAGSQVQPGTQRVSWAQKGGPSGQNQEHREGGKRAAE